MKGMNILLVTPGLPPDRTGGIENYVDAMFNEMSRRGHTVKVLTQYHRRRIENPNVCQVSTPSGEAAGYAQWVLKGWFPLGLASPNVIHFNGFPGQLLSLTPLARVPKIVHIHNSLTMEPGYYRREVQRHKLGYLLASRAYRRASMVISPTQVVKDDLVSHVKGIDPSRIRVIPNCVDTQYYSRNGFRNEIREKYNLKDKFVILYFGKIKPTKGVETLCKAFQIVRKKIDAALIIGGAAKSTDPFMGYLSATYKDVIFTGFVDDPRKYYAAADAYCIYTPGFHGGETFAISLAEAMSMSLPIVCSENPIFREVTDGNALFGVPENAESLANCLVQLARDSEGAAEMGKASRRFAERMYDSRRVADKVEAAYREAIR